MAQVDVWKKIIQTIDPLAQEAINAYLNEEIDKATDRLVKSDDPHETRMLQGAIRSLRSVLNIRTKAERVLMNGNR